MYRGPKSWMISPATAINETDPMEDEGAPVINERNFHIEGTAGMGKVEIKYMCFLCLLVGKKSLKRRSTTL